MKKRKLILSLMALVLCMFVMKTGIMAKQTAEAEEAVLSINATSCNIEITVSDAEDFVYNYNKNIFNIQMSGDKNKSISVSKNKNANTTTKDTVEIKIPKSIPFQQLNLKSDCASIEVCAINKPITISANYGDITINMPKDFSNDFSCSGVESAIAIIADKKADYVLNITNKNSAISLPEEYTAWDYSKPTYQYIQGKGKAAVNLDVDTSAVKVTLK